MQIRIGLSVLKRFLQRLVALVACLYLCGGHWGVLQVVAWGGMMVAYSQRDGVALAARKTFDGAHPCALCRVIGSGRSSEQQLPSNRKRPRSEWSKLGSEFSMALAVEVRPPARAELAMPALPEPSGGFSAWVPSPPTPPPRGPVRPA